MIYASGGKNMSSTEQKEKADQSKNYQRLGGAKKLTLIDAVAQSVGFMGPVFSIAFLVPLLVGINAAGIGAGAAAPLSVLIAAGWALRPGSSTTLASSPSAPAFWS